MLYYFGKGKVLQYINKILEIPVEGIFDLARTEEFNIQNVEGLYTGIKDLQNI